MEYKFQKMAIGHCHIRFIIVHVTLKKYFCLLLAAGLAAAQTRRCGRLRVARPTHDSAIQYKTTTRCASQETLDLDEDDQFDRAANEVGGSAAANK